MKQNITTKTSPTDASRTIRHLEVIFHELNMTYFNGELHPPIILISSKSNLADYVDTNPTWIRHNGGERFELNLNASILTTPIENIAATMLHLMIHQYAIQNGIKDTSRCKTYHNKRFRNLAISHGLDVEYCKSNGWEITSPSNDLKALILANGWDDMMVCPKSSSPTKRPSSTRKIQCPLCKQSVRATKHVNILCGDCMIKMIEV